MTMKSLFVFVYLLSFSRRCHCFVQQQQLSPRHVTIAGKRSHFSSSIITIVLQSSSDKLNREINERSLQKSFEERSGGSAVVGAVLGGLVGGPFGAMFGASLGDKMGARNAFDNARKEEMERMGITQEMINAADDVGLALEQSLEGMEATKASLRSQQQMAKMLDSDGSDLYEKAKKALVSGNEEEAKSLLLKRNENQENLKRALKLCAEEKSRVAIMEQNVRELQKRALDIETMLTRAVGAKTRSDNSLNADFTLPPEDPLLKKFKDLGID